MYDYLNKIGFFLEDDGSLLKEWATSNKLIPVSLRNELEKIDP